MLLLSLYLHNKELVLFANYNYNYQVKEDEIGRACSTNRTKRNLCRILMGKPKGKKPQGRPRRRRLNNIKMDLREL
jgi:hypothetical protein